MWDLRLKWGIWESDWYHITYLAHAWLPAPREQGTRLHSLLCPPWYLGLGCGRVEVSRWIIHSLVGKQFGGPWSWEVTRIEGLQVSQALAFGGHCSQVLTEVPASAYWKPRSSLGCSRSAGPWRTAVCVSFPAGAGWVSPGVAGGLNEKGRGWFAERIECPGGRLVFILRPWGFRVWKQLVMLSNLSTVQKEPVGRGCRDRDRQKPPLSLREATMTKKGRGLEAWEDQRVGCCREGGSRGSKVRVQACGSLCVLETRNWGRRYWKRSKSRMEMFILGHARPEGSVWHPGRCTRSWGGENSVVLGLKKALG